MDLTAIRPDNCNSLVLLKSGFTFSADYKQQTINLLNILKLYIYFSRNRASLVHKNANHTIVFNCTLHLLNFIFDFDTWKGCKNDFHFSFLWLFLLFIFLISYNYLPPPFQKLLHTHGRFRSHFNIAEHNNMGPGPCSDTVLHLCSRTKRTDNVPIQTKLIRNIENH